MSHNTSSSTNSNGILFSAAAFSAHLAADIVKLETEEQINAREMKNLNLKIGQETADSLGAQAIAIGKQEQNASVADGMASMITGGAMGLGELGSLGVGICRGQPDLTEKLKNNRECKAILENPKATALIVNGAPAAGAAESTDVIRKRVENHNPDASFEKYNGDKAGFENDIAILKEREGSGKGTTIDNLRKRTKEQMKATKDAMQPYDNMTETVKNFGKQVSQSAGYFGAGYQNQLRGEAQKNKSIEECFNTTGQFQQQSAKTNADTEESIAAQAREVKDGAINAWSKAIDANSRA